MELCFWSFTFIILTEQYFISLCSNDCNFFLLRVFLHSWKHNRLFLNLLHVFLNFWILLNLSFNLINIRKIVLLSCNSHSNLEISLLKLLTFEYFYQLIVILFSLNELLMILVFLRMINLLSLLKLVNLWQTSNHFDVLKRSFLFILLGFKTSRNCMVFV